MKIPNFNFAGMFKKKANINNSENDGSVNASFTSETSEVGGEQVTRADQQSVHVKSEKPNAPEASELEKLLMNFSDIKTSSRKGDVLKLYQNIDKMLKDPDQIMAVPKGLERQNSTLQSAISTRDLPLLTLTLKNLAEQDLLEKALTHKNADGHSPVHTAVLTRDTNLLKLLILAKLKPEVLGDLNVFKKLASDSNSESDSKPYNDNLNSKAKVSSIISAFDIRASLERAFQNITGEEIFHTKEDGLPSKKFHIFGVVDASKPNESLSELLNLQDSEKSTALHVAARRGDLEMINLLVNCGADKTIKNRNGEFPATIAMIKGHVNSLKVLEPENLKELNILNKQAASVYKRTNESLSSSLSDIPGNLNDNPTIAGTGNKDWGEINIDVNDKTITDSDLIGLYEKNKIRNIEDQNKKFSDTIKSESRLGKKPFEIIASALKEVNNLK
jgi:ankyrin repeat protein